jgi:hypothetical protein
MTDTTALLTGLAQLAATTADFAWHPDGSPYSPGQCGIYIGRLQQTARQGLALQTYEPGGDETTGADSLVGVQVRLRGGPDSRQTLDRADALYALLHGRWGAVLGGVQTRSIRLYNSTPLGWENDQYEHVANYYVQLQRTSPTRT